VLERLLDLQFDDDDDGQFLSLVAASWSATGLRLQFRKGSGDRSAALEVVCREVLDHSLSFGICSPEVVEDHPLLWARRETAVEVYFHGTPTQPLDLIEARLLFAHEAEAGGWLPHRRGAPLDGRFGLVAVVPERLARTYVSILEEAGLQANTISPGGPLVSTWLHETSRFMAPGEMPLHLLLLGGRSFVLATDFEETVVDPSE
jgi:hypothetical protein